MTRKYRKKRKVSIIAEDSLGLMVLIIFAVIINEVAQKLGAVAGITGDTIVALFLATGLFYAFKQMGEYGKSWGV